MNLGGVIAAEDYSTLKTKIKDLLEKQEKLSLQFLGITTGSLEEDSKSDDLDDLELFMQKNAEDLRLEKKAKVLAEMKEVDQAIEE